MEILFVLFTMSTEFKTLPFRFPQLLNPYCFCGDATSFWCPVSQTIQAQLADSLIWHNLDKHCYSNL